MITPLSVLILSCNDENSIDKALNSVIGWSDDIVVLDSYSIDKTDDVLKRFPQVRVIKKEFIDFASQRNFGLHEINYKYDWLFMLDSDECCPDKLKVEIQEKILSTDLSSVSILAMRRKDFYNGSWIRCHSDMWFQRLLRHNQVHYEGIVHEKINGKYNQINLNSYLEHFPFSKGVHEWVVRHSSYAKIMADLEQKNQLTLKYQDLFNRNAHIKNRAQKALFLRLPGRCCFYFLYKFFFKKGFLSGINGLYFVALETFYQFLVSANRRSIRKGHKNASF